MAAYNCYLNELSPGDKFKWRETHTNIFTVTDKKVIEGVTYIGVSGESGWWGYFHPDGTCYCTDDLQTP